MTSKQFEDVAREDRETLMALEPVSFTYSFNGVERTILGQVEERDDRIILYEYRGKYVGTEFFISFSKESDSYKLIRTDSSTSVQI